VKEEEEMEVVVEERKEREGVVNESVEVPLGNPTVKEEEDM
jgi:hypothetical protein